MRLDYVLGRIIFVLRMGTKTKDETENQDHFYLGFIDCANLCYRLSKAESNVLFVCIAMSKFYDDETLENPGCEFISNLGVRIKMSKLTGLNEFTIKDAMTSLCKRGILLRSDNKRGVYYLNPMIIYKGDMSLRRKLISGQMKRSWHDALMKAQKQNNEDG